MSKNILITGGAGFIGSHVVKRFVSKYPKYNIINIDKLTYAGDLKNVVEVQNKKNYFFENVDICNYDKILKIFESYKISHIINLAAESHVDRSIEDPFIFAKSNVLGTLSLLNAAKTYWKNNFKNKLFYHISTDEVYGSLGDILEDAGIKKYSIEKGISTKSSEFGIPPSSSWIKIFTKDQEKFFTVQDTIKEGYFIDSEIK